MDGSIVVLQLSRFQRSMAGNRMRQMAYDECQNKLFLFDFLVFVIGMAKNIPNAKEKHWDCNAN